MKFPYARYGDYFMPVIPVTLCNGNLFIVTEALVDSGAANCLFDGQIAKALGIEHIENGDALELEGISGHCIRGYLHPVTLHIGGHRLFRATVAFTSVMPDNAVNILGQQGFFEFSSVKFSYRKKEFDITFD